MISFLSNRLKLISKQFDKFTKGNKQLVINFVSLGTVQLTNFILPLLVYPYLYKTTGSKNFGSIVYALNVFLYLSTVIDYGYSTSAPKNLPIIKEKEALSKKISVIIQTKLTLLSICIVLLVICLNFSNITISNKNLYLYGLVLLAGNSLLPTWLFQGMEEMKHLTWINLSAKVLSITLIFLNIKHQEDYIFSLAWIGSANFLSGFVGIWYAYKRFGLKMVFASSREVLIELKGGWYYFLSYFSSVLYSNSTIIILGFFVSDTSLGNYGIAEKIAFSLWQIITVFSQVTFPVMCRLYSESRDKLNNFIKTYHHVFIYIISILCAAMFMTANQIISLATNTESSEAANILRVLTVFPFIVVLNVPASQLITINEKQKYIAYAINFFGVIGLILCYIFTQEYGAIGAAFTAVSTQFFLTFSLYYILRTKIPEGVFWNKQ
ncbi:oligosaccharide flippase family protein [uncultured Spirosoma sp.]|uniref:oligosaccharide flippase family protein n=1 Tax=uncultured Spirosoma sp. TaxID=278208 RepID=UPI002587F1F3|nr:oligosaccharide flippase family protein [uncultured Spirosoma sp.]